MLPTICDPSELDALLPRALTGEMVLAPVASSAIAATVAMLRPEVPVEESDAAVIVATSGSTGAPKGVVLSRHALLAAASSAQEVLGEPLAWTLALPAHYVAGLMVLVRAHAAGTPVTRVGSDLAGLVPPSVPSAISLVPTQLHRALGDPGLTAALRGYRAILLGGAAASGELLLRAGSQGLNVITTYGMSETCGGCVWDGVPLPGVDIGLDDDDRIALGGPMVFSGYRLRPDLTAAVLREGRVLTNDRGGCHDGRLHVLGRLDDVVVTGGVNVDLAALERGAQRLATSEVAVVAVPDEMWGVTIVLVDTGERPLAEWREALRPAFEAAALPRGILRVPALPRTESGKIDRQTLRRLAARRNGREPGGHGE